MTTRHGFMMFCGGQVSIGNERIEDQDPTPNDDTDDGRVLDKGRKDRPAPEREPAKDAPPFAPGSPENVPPQPASSDGTWIRSRCTSFCPSAFPSTRS